MRSLALIGGSGFIGKSIIDYVDKNKGTNLKIKKIYSYQQKKFSHITKNVQLEFINKDFLNVRKLPDLDYIIFLIKSDTLKKSKLICNHFEKKLLQLTKKPKILYLSSGVVYGASSKNIKIQESKPINTAIINNFKNYKKNYAKEKIFFEKKLLTLRKKKFKVSIVRGFTYVGKHIPQNSIYLIGNFIKSIINKKKLILRTNIKVVRSYMHEEDLARCILKIIYLKKTDGKIYNVGSDDVIDARYLANKLSKKYNLKLIQKKIDEKKIDYYVPDIKKIKKELNFKLKSLSYKSIIKTINLLKN
jgi:nucleoside-diphosphate-sugar epimerase